jgi:hypothetical protein
MSSATSTDEVRLPSPELRPGKPDTTGKRGVRLQADLGLQPWQFFVLAALICATGVTYLVRGQGVTTVLLLSVLMATTAIVGLAVLRAVRPLVTTQEDRTPMVGDRTRAALEREKMLALRTLKELEFDRSMKKISEDDYREMSTRLRARASRIIRQLDAGSGYRTKIEADLAKRLGAREAQDSKARPQTLTCAACQTPNDIDAKFCKNCGQKL